MGAANPVALAMIREHLGVDPRTEFNDDGTMSLHIGDIVVTAEAGLWSDPSTFIHDDGSLSVSWCGQVVQIPAPSDDRQGATIYANPLRGRARWVS